jgi:hypothetical protein
MVRQIVVKLNEKEFLPVLDLFKNISGATWKSNSNMVSKCVYFTYLYLFQELSENGKTRAEIIKEKYNITERKEVLKETLLKMAKEYNIYKEKGNLKLPYVT